MMDIMDRKRITDTDFMKAVRKKVMEWEALADDGYDFTSEDVKNMMKTLRIELETQLSLPPV